MTVQRYNTTKRARTGGFLGAVAMLVGLGAATVEARAQSEPIRGGTIRTIGISFRSLNPAVQSGNATAMPGTQLFAGLVEIGEGFKPIPYLAKSWTIAPDFKTHTFKMAEGATFHDGKPLTSADVAYSMGVVKANHPFGPIMHANLLAVETPDAETVIFRHSQPAQYFMQTLAPHLMPVLPKHVYDDGQDIKTHPKNMQNVVGSGPFKLAEHKPGQFVIFERFDGFVRKGRPYVDKIAMLIQGDAATRLLSFEKGDVDYFPWTGFSERDVRKLEKMPGVEIVSKGYEAAGHINYLELNLRRQPFDDVRVRQALAHAINKEFISKTLFLGVHPPADGILHPSNPLYSEAPPKFNGGIEKAKALLDEAGLKPDANGIRFKMAIDMPSFGEGYLSVMADYFRAEFKKIGVEVSIRKAPDFGTWSNRVGNWDYDATMNAVWNYPDPVIGVHRLLACDNIRKQIWTNTQGYCNKQVDALMSKAAITTDLEERRKLYREFSQITSSEQAMIFLTFHVFSTAQRSFVKDAPVGPWGGLGPWDGMHMVKK